MHAGQVYYALIKWYLFPSVSEQDISSAWDWDILVTGRQQSFPTGTHEEMSSDDKASYSQIEGLPDSQKMHPAEVDPHDKEDERFCSLEGQESSSSVKDRNSQLVLPATINVFDYGLQMQLRPTLQMQKLLGAVFNPRCNLQPRQE